MTEKQDIAFVTGYIGRKFYTKIPDKPNQYDSYYITDNRRIYFRLKFTKWQGIFIKDVRKLLSTFSPNNQFSQYDNINKLDKINQKIFYAMASKALKVYPNHFLPKQYQYLIWFDNKFNVNLEGTLKSIKSYNKNIAIMLHKHPFVENIAKELTESKKQKRYARQEDRYVKYIDNNVNNGLSKHHYIHYQSGYLLYNIKHKQTANIQKIWQQHINDCGINCQITFNFVAQLFDQYIDEYIYDIKAP